MSLKQLFRIAVFLCLHLKLHFDDIIEITVTDSKK